MKLFAVIFLCIAALNAASLNKVKQEQKYQRIIGGQAAHPQQFPYAAAIYVQTSDSRYFCGGTLLSNLWVLTGGQCVDGATLFQIFLGSVSLETDSPYQIEVATSTYYLHPNYNAMTLENDIGLIHLRLPISFSDYLKPIDRLPVFEVPDYITVSAYGWGQVNDLEAGLSNDLQWVTVATLTNEECRLTYGNQITDNMLCAEGNYNQGICNGDTGGALIQYYSTGQDIVVGVASFISGNGCESTDPSGYTRVYPYSDWIRNVTELDL